MSKTIELKGKKSFQSLINHLATNVETEQELKWLGFKKIKTIPKSAELILNDSTFWGQNEYIIFEKNQPFKLKTTSCESFILHSDTLSLSKISTLGCKNIKDFKKQYSHLEGKNVILINFDTCIK